MYINANSLPISAAFDQHCQLQYNCELFLIYCVCCHFARLMLLLYLYLYKAAMDQPRKNRLLTLILGKQALAKVASCKVLVVGAGGIGCELIKNLSKSGYKNITLLDFDSIEITNLNRQFYFRKEHVGRSKAETVKDMLAKLDSSIKIQAINASIYDLKFNQLFYRDFSLIFSCLDNMKAREHLAAQATKNGKPLIDAGTMSYFGQAYSSIRFRNSCHNCNPTHSEQTPAFCTIRSHPQLPLHCATYAKNFYDSFFGVNQAESLSDKLKYSNYVKSEQLSKEEIAAIGQGLFQEMFNNGVHDVDLEGNKIDFVRKLASSTAIALQQIVKNPSKSTFNQEQDRKQALSPYKQDKLWSISEYYHKFHTSISNLLSRKLQGTSPASFDKDDEDCMTLILCITNLRTYNFISEESPHNKHKYLTYYQCKDMIGKVFPAIASANAIGAALQAREALNILTGQLDKMRYISFGNRSDERLSPSFQSEPNLQCQICSQKIVYVGLVCDMKTTTFRHLEDFTKANCFTRNRDVNSGAISIVRSSKRGGDQNRDKHLDFFPEMIHNGVLELSFLPHSEEPQYTVYVSVLHAKGEPGIRLQEGSPSRSAISKQLRSFFRRARQQFVSNHLYELQINGGYEL